uniref:POM121 transmembrane nucleoporin n=1 Tax=Poecilia reticulata TaxID=8081 RepID=A0A3P9PUF8_POERE
MSPREKHLALFSGLCLVLLVFYYIPIFIYGTLILSVCCFAFYYRSGEHLPARLGPNPRGGLHIPAVFRDWLPGLKTTGVSLAARGKPKRSISSYKAEHRETEGHFRQRPSETGIYRREALTSDSFLFSPRDFLMGSYIGKPESPTADSGRPRAGRNPREQLRERLARPNHAVYTPNRRLSFTGETLGAPGRFTITPQRHYPLQQLGVSSVGVLPPVKWDGFRKKNILSPRNSPAALSPVTVKIARPDHRNPSVNHQSCAGLTRASSDPCSRESVLRVLKESRKREVEDEDRSFTTEQRSKRRRNDSDGSSHSAFEPLLPNGTASQLVPKPGSLKRGMTSAIDETTLKRSRTSSISSGSGAHGPRGTPSTRRNAIQSSYSSTVGLSQVQRCHRSRDTGFSLQFFLNRGVGVSWVRCCFINREEDIQSPSSASSVRSNHTMSEKTPDTSKQTPVPKVPVTTTRDSTGSGGKRKRKIQLVSSNRDDQISLPPPPELGYTITARDLDEEKKAAISKIQKVLETPETSMPPEASTSTQPAAPTATLSSLLAAPLPTSTSVVPVINLDPIPGGSSSAAAPAGPSTLLEALKVKISVPTMSASATAPPATTFTLKTSTPIPTAPPASQFQSPSSAAAVGQPSAFTQVLAQVSKATTSIPAASITGPTLFGLPALISTSSAPSVSTTAAPPLAPTSSSQPISTTNPLLTAVFKPIFAAATTTSSSAASSETKPLPQNFKPIFPQPPSISATSTASTLSATTMSVFGVTTSSSSSFSGFNNASAGIATTTQPATLPGVKSVFGNWSPPSTGSMFQFGAAAITAATTTAASAPAISKTSNFSFGAAQPDPQAPKVFSFGQPSSCQSTTTDSFGGFGLANTVSSATATAAPTTATTHPTQPTFTFGKPAFEAPAAQPAFSSSSAPPKPFTFGSGGASSTTAGTATAPAPFTFAAPAPATATSAPTFGTPAKPAFGAGSTGFAFGANAAPSVTPSFGGSTQTQSSSTSTFPFGSSSGGAQSAASGSAQPATGGFNFGASMSCPQFGTPVSSNTAPQMGSFNFGAGAAADKPAFGESEPNVKKCLFINFFLYFTGSPATPTFSIGAGSKPSGARQRLQARRLHNRKK